LEFRNYTEFIAWRQNTVYRVINCWNPFLVIILISRPKIDIQLPKAMFHSSVDHFGTYTYTHSGSSAASSNCDFYSMRPSQETIISSFSPAAWFSLMEMEYLPHTFNLSTIQIIKVGWFMISEPFLGVPFFLSVVVMFS